MSDLYGDDILLWSKRQIGLLRQIADGEQAPEPPDWVNIAAELEEIDKKATVRSSLQQKIDELHEQIAKERQRAAQAEAKLRATSDEVSALRAEAEARRRWSLARRIRWVLNGE
ncbi:MAG: DUF29 family protein [Acetobacteraceae bacterium]|nr:DUF29 family protein [Acetobacteraceae bacterium]